MKSWMSAALATAAGLAQDLRHAFRLLRRNPRHGALVIVTMAIGIGVTTTLFSVTYGVLMRPLPWPDEDRIVVLEETRGGKPPRFGAFSNTAYLAWSEAPEVIDRIAAWSQRTATLEGDGEAERIRLVAASASLFEVLRAQPLIGTLFHADDEQSLHGDVVLLSESLWRKRFGGDAAALGRVVKVDGQSCRIVGILPEAFAFPDRQAVAWVPFRVMPSTGSSLSMFNAIARLRPGESPSAAAAEGTARGRFAPDTGMTTMAIFGSNGPIEVSAIPLRERWTSDVRRPLTVLLAAVGLLLATGTANVAGLQLARATGRRREFAIRAALGAGGPRVMRQLLVESLLLGLAGGGLGLLFASLLHDALPLLLPAGFPRADELKIDVTVVAFAAAVSVVTGLVFGVLPGLRARRIDLVEALAEEGSVSIGLGIRSGTARARLLIMAGQVAIATVLLVGGSLLGRSFVNLLAADRGYDPTGVLTARLAFPPRLYPPERAFRLVSGILERLSQAPAASHAAFTSDIPLTPGGSTAAFTMRARRSDSGAVSAQASPRIVSRRYFTAAGMRVLEGRGFGEQDTEGSEPVALVNRAFVRRYLQGSPLGERIPMGLGYGIEGRSATIIGVVDDVRYLTAGDSSQPEIYYSFQQLGGRLPVPVVTLLVRTAGDPSTLAEFLRTTIREADPTLVPEAVMTMEDRVWTSVARPRLYAVMLGGFAVFALVVATVGLFGVLSYTVALRSRELGVRAALGATQCRILRLVLGEGLRVAMGGVAAGLMASYAFMRTIGALLYGITPHDPITYLTVPILLLLVSGAACLAPAWRAARRDPLSALRS